jgi:hypothetical protein
MSLGIRSWHWSWWIPDRVVLRDEVEAISMRTIFGAAKFSIDVRGGARVTLRTSTAVNQLANALRANGYPLR